MNIYHILSIVLLTLFSNFCCADKPDFDTVEGGALYLTRSGFETHRAEFRYAQDCELVAKIMNKAEPSVDWHCSTSVPDIKLSCEIKDFILDSESESVTEIKLPDSLDFKLVLNRGMALGESEIVYLPLKFRYTKSKSSYLLTNDYPYASGNYFTRAVYVLIINIENGKVEIRDIGGQSNGTGICNITP